MKNSNTRYGIWDDTGGDWLMRNLPKDKAEKHLQFYLKNDFNAVLKPDTLNQETGEYENDRIEESV